MATGIATFGAILSNVLTGAKTVAPPPVSLTAAVDVIETRNSSNLALLQPGDNTINVPTGATFAVLAFPATPNTITWKGAGGDTGTQMLANTAISLFAVMLVSGLSSFILNASALTPNVEVNFI